MLGLKYHKAYNKKKWKKLLKITIQIKDMTAVNEKDNPPFKEFLKTNIL